MCSKTVIFLSLVSAAWGLTLPFEGSVVAMAPDGRGSIYVIGNTNSTSLPVSANAYQKFPRGGLCVVFFRIPYLAQCTSGWVARLNAASMAIEALTYLGAEGENTLSGISLDRDGLPVVTGTATQRQAGRDVYPRTAGSVRSPEPASGTVMTVSRLGAGLDMLIDSTWLRGSLTASGSSIELDAEGRILMVGKTTSPDFPATPDWPTVCGPKRGARPDLAWWIAIQLSPRLERVGRVVHLNEKLAPGNVPFLSKVACLFGGGNYEFERTFGAGQLMTMIGGPFAPEEEIRVGGIRAVELYRSIDQINFVLPRELGFRESVEVTVGGEFARSITVREVWPRWKWYIDSEGSLAYQGASVIDARRPNGSQNTPGNPLGKNEEVRAYATGIDLSKPLELFADFFNLPYPNFTASYVEGTYESVVEFRFLNPINATPPPGSLAMGIVNGGIPSNASAATGPGILVSEPL